MNGFRSVRWIRTVNLLAQAVLVVTLCAGLNYVAFNHSLRWDLTARNRFSLSPETKAYLRNLEQPVRVVVTLAENSEVPQVEAALPDIKGLLREYSYTTENNPVGKISVEYIDIYARNQDAARLRATEANVVKFFCGDRERIVTLADLYRMEGAQLTAFLGEQVFTNAILDVAKSQKKVYFLSGHGEYRIDLSEAEGLSVLADALRRRNFSVGTVDILANRGIPDDASLLIAVLRDTSKIEPIVQEQLRQYLSSTTQNGRLILFVPPGIDSNELGLYALLEEWGVWLNNDVVIERDPRALADRHMLVVHLVEHPITQALSDIKTQALHVGLSRSLRPFVGGSKLSGLQVTTLAATSTSAWGEVNFLSGSPPEYNPGVDLKGIRALEPADRLGLAIASERVRPRENLPFSVANGRLVVFGSVDYATNQWFDPFPGNQSIVLNAVSWASGRDKSWFNIPARTIDRFQLSLSSRDLTRLRYSLLLLLPGTAALLGIFVYWTRRT